MFRLCLYLFLFQLLTSCSKEPEIQKSEFAGEWDGHIAYPTQFSPYIATVFVKVNEAGAVTGTYEYYNSERKIMGKVYANGIWNANISGYGDKGTIAGTTKDKKKFTGSFFYTDLSSNVYEGSVFLTKR